MNRVVVRIITVVLVGLAGGISASACASDQGVFEATSRLRDASVADAATLCDPKFCPASTTGPYPACCFSPTPGSCGIDFGTGCVAIAHHRDGG